MEKFYDCNLIIKQLTNEGNIWINTLPKPKSDSNIRYNNKTKA